MAGSYLVVCSTSPTLLYRIASVEIANQLVSINRSEIFTVTLLPFLLLFPLQLQFRDICALITSFCAQVLSLLQTLAQENLTRSRLRKFLARVSR